MTREQKPPVNIREALIKRKLKLSARKAYIAIPYLSWRDVRKKLGLTQEEFCLIFGLPLATYRNWEQDRREPRGTAVQVLLHLIANDPEGIAKEVARIHKDNVIPMAFPRKPA